MIILKMKEKILYFIIPISVIIITGLFIAFFWTDMFRLGTHFGISEIKIEDGCIVGRAKNVGSFNVEMVRIVACVKGKDGSYREIIIPLDPLDLEVGEEVEFSKRLEDPENIDNNYIRAIIGTR